MVIIAVAESTESAKMRDLGQSFVVRLLRLRKCPQAAMKCEFASVFSKMYKT